MEQLARAGLFSSFEQGPPSIPLSLAVCRNSATAISSAQEKERAAQPASIPACSSGQLSGKSPRRTMRVKAA